MRMATNPRGGYERGGSASRVEGAVRLSYLECYKKSDRNRVKHVASRSIGSTPRDGLAILCRLNRLSVIPATQPRYIIGRRRGCIQLR